LELYHYASEQEWWIYVDPATLNKRPGDYVLRVKGVSGTASASINFYTPGRAMRLAEVDVQALQQVRSTLRHRNLNLGTERVRPTADGAHPCQQ
jgi:hypothetical protein